MNPQGQNAQQNNPHPAAPPAGRWDEGANLNNAPVLLPIPPRGGPWRQRCADAGYIAGDEQVQRYLQDRPLLDDEGRMNTAGIFGFVGTADSVSADRAKGIDRPLAELASLMQARNWTMDEIDQAQTALDERALAQQDAAQALLHGKQSGASHEVLVSLQATLDKCESEMEKQRSTLSAEQGELRKLQNRVEKTQRMVLKMVHGEQPVGSMAGPAQGGAVQPIPDPDVFLNVGRILARRAWQRPMTAVKVMLLMNVVMMLWVVTVVTAVTEAREYLQPPADPDGGAGNGVGVWPMLPVLTCVVLAYISTARNFIEDDPDNN